MPGFFYLISLRVRPPIQIIKISTPAKAHLKDGGDVFFPDGSRVVDGLLPLNSSCRN
jgi:hypothetical protein